MNKAAFCLLFLLSLGPLAHAQQATSEVTAGTFSSAILFGRQGTAGKAQISIPGVKGMLELDVGPTTWEAHVRADGRETQLRAMHRSDNLLVSAFLQRVKFPASAERCRAEWWPGTAKALRVKREELSQSERNGIAIVEYIVPKFQGLPIRQKTIHAYLGTRDLCAEVHLSKVQFVAEDQKLFDDLLATVRLLPDESAPSPQGQDLKNQYLAEGSRLYLQRKFA